MFLRLVVAIGSLEHSKHSIPPSACSVNTFMRRDSSKPFSLIHDWYVLLDVTESVFATTVDEDVVGISWFC